jgi:cytochrome bd ubiquinol oxidase subunit II
MELVWFCLGTAMIAGYVILDGFDLGAGIVQLFVAKSNDEKARVLRTIGPVWDGNEVWLVAAGGVLFLAFPILYASSFSGFYLALMLVLWLLILRGISIEFRNHIDNPLWISAWDTVFGAASAVLAFVFGVALGNVVRGVPLDQNGYFFLPLWTNLLPGADAGVIDWYTLLVGATAFVALAVHGSLWVAMKTAGRLQEGTRALSAKFWRVLVLLTLVISPLSFAIQPNLWKQFTSHPWGVVLPALALAGLLAVRTLSARRKDKAAFLSSSLYLAGMLASVAFGVFPNVLPSNTTPDFSLTIYNAAAADQSLRIALWWFIPGMALATAYSVFTYRHFAGRVDEQGGNYDFRN